MPSLQDIAETARRELMSCSHALDEAAGVRGKLFDVVERPFLMWKLRLVRKHRAAAKRNINTLHAELHDRASLGVANADLWSAITRAVDALALSRWLNTREITIVDIAPARETVHLLLAELTTLLALLDELSWPDEAKQQPSDR